MTRRVSAQALRAMLADGAELAILDAREEGAFFNRHLFYAAPLPLSRLELRAADLVPRRNARVVVCDAGEGVAERAASRLERFGYSDVAVLDGGVAAWAAAGFELFSGVHVPSKAFGELVEHDAATPNLAATELAALIDAGADLVVLDSRPMDEYARMNIPGGIDVPGAELVLRVHDLAPDPATLVVVNCAGRTRSIIGAQSLINAGIPNRVAALRNGTMGWELAGFALEHGQARRYGALSAKGRARAEAAAARVARRFGVRTIDRATLAAWQAEAGSRSLYLLDVRGEDEYRAGHMPGAVHAPGGQLVQATDAWVATLGARLVLIDDDGVRATMTASWLVQMGWDAVVLSGGLDGALEAGPRAGAVLGLDDATAETVAPPMLARWLADGEAVAVDLSPSRAYRAGHIPGAWFAVRARLDTALAQLAPAPVLALVSEDGVLARLAAGEAAAHWPGRVVVLEGGTQRWQAAGLPLVAGEERMADAADDVALKPYDRAGGVREAMESYLSWELGLREQVARDGTARFRLRGR